MRVGHGVNTIQYNDWQFFSVALQPKSDLDRLIVDVSRSHIIRNTKPTGFLRTSDQFVAETATLTTHNKHNRRTSVLSAGFEPAILLIDGPQTHALERTATEFDLTNIYQLLYNISDFGRNSELGLQILRDTNERGWFNLKRVILDEKMIWK
jgi:hypothetical protein